ncbi:DNA-binding transcriptional regulator, LysR family [Vibrio xiamenensis]|uniref:DNA-binding transcriptional regulator, LysR family n=1 Tax=Vibrio xiamenensis TaxID=861298 RepID=A0A1G8CJ66_9VIBR|nr:LysR family transcriptional regulator [Vibrio xiamenensis]SDH45253.1 DNA-binding transcriptional regulator, LysR family [Vibrio xiamenensis]
MHEKTLLTKDLNLLLLLSTLHEERSTASAAERLFVTQSAVSKGLKKLREQLNDPLFVRTRGSFVPTERCDELVGKITPILDDIKNVYIGTSDQFSRSEYSGEICVAINTTMNFAFGDEVYRQLHGDFPDATIRIMNWSDSTEQRLLNNKIQIGINYYPIDVSKDLNSDVMFQEQFHLITRKSHPLSDKKLVSLNDVTQHPFVVSVIPNYSAQKSKIEYVLNKMKLKSKIVLRSDNVNLCLDVLNQSDAIMPIHSLFKNKVSSDYSILDTDFDMDIYGKSMYVALFYTSQLTTTQLGTEVFGSVKKALYKLRTNGIA